MSTQRKEYTLTCTLGEFKSTRRQLGTLVEERFIESVTGITVAMFMLYLTEDETTACRAAGLTVELEQYDLGTCRARDTEIFY